MWISVTDRLPERFGSYLVCVFGVVTVFSYWPEEQRWENIGGGHRYCDSVAHWQPLPAPPGAEKEEG